MMVEFRTPRAGNWDIRYFEKSSRNVMVFDPSPATKGAGCLLINRKIRSMLFLRIAAISVPLNVPDENVNCRIS